ncbi:MAG: hybrid sensor histidine kinase/response regulator [Desulfosarcinaceae bacterium]|nr:hybrid sensor histidine kinase/response regulator [Desulfosarcinaceae bacterium]
MKLPNVEKTLLLVDDEADIREVLTLALADLGYRVTSAENGTTALPLFLDIRPPVVITDIKMPGMDGIELLSRIKAADPDAEVIMITGHGDLDLAIMSLKNQATDFITKPINVDALEIALRRAEERIILRRQLKAYTERLEQLVQEKAALKDHLSSLGMMLGSISHGIKGLLTSLDGGLYLVESGFVRKHEDTVEEGWQIVKQTVERIRKLMLDILFYTKKRKFTFTQVAVGTFCKELADEMVAKLRRRKIRFRPLFTAQLGAFAIDADYLRAALGNILDNAIDACETLEGESAGQIDLRVTADDERVYFEVRDNGIGMEPAVLNNLFTVFYSTKGKSGTGLGLFVANQVVEQHGGKIRVRSQPGRGTRFRVMVPRSPLVEA